MGPIHVAPLLLVALLFWSLAAPVHAAERHEPVALVVHGEGLALSTTILTLSRSFQLARSPLSASSNWPGLFAMLVRVQSVTEAVLELTRQVRRRMPSP